MNGAHSITPQKLGNLIFQDRENHYCDEIALSLYWLQTNAMVLEPFRVSPSSVEVIILKQNKDSCWRAGIFGLNLVIQILGQRGCPKTR